MRKITEKTKQVIRLINDGMIYWQIDDIMDVSHTTVWRVISIYKLNEKMRMNLKTYYNKVIGFMICRYGHKVDVKRVYIWHVNNSCYYLCSICKCGFTTKKLKELIIFD